MSRKSVSAQQEIRTMATFIKIQRPLLPSPPKDAEPWWCYVNTLIFHDKAGNKVWEQEIPEAELAWVEVDDGCNPLHDVFDHYFWPFRVFWEDGFGWQLEFGLDHERAKKWLRLILAERENHHNQHFQIAK